VADSDPPDAPAGAAGRAVGLDSVTRRYAETTAVDDVSLAIREGEFFTLVGPSGCGKTTTLRLVGGFESPTTGAVRLAGEDVAGVPPESRDVGVVFQSYALFPHMTVRENVGYGLRFSDPPGGVSTAGGSRTCSNWWTWRGWATGTRTNSRAGSASGSRSPGRSPPAPGCSCSTNR
jgi:ABC-type spermidine/putrescine transport systems, ATPase components